METYGKITQSNQLCFKMCLFFSTDFQSATFSDVLEIKQTRDIVQMSSRAQFSTGFENLV